MSAFLWLAYGPRFLTSLLLVTFHKPNLLRIVKTLKASLIDSIGARDKSFNYHLVADYSRALL